MPSEPQAGVGSGEVVEDLAATINKSQNNVAGSDKMPRRMETVCGYWLGQIL